MEIGRFCRCFCGKGDLDLDQKKVLQDEFETVYDNTTKLPIQPSSAVVSSFSTSPDQPMRGEPIRTGTLWYLLADEQVQEVTFVLYINGFSIALNSKVSSISLSPFCLVRNCKFQDPYMNTTLADLQIFKISLFTQNLCYYLGVRGSDADAVAVERRQWVTEIARVIKLVSQSLFPCFSISCAALKNVPTTRNRLMAGYLIHHTSKSVVTVLYGELHPHCAVSYKAKMAFYENELCQKIILVIPISAGTVCVGKIGVECTCFCVDGYEFSTRTSSERTLWLRAISNLKVKLTHEAPTPSDKEIAHYRQAIEEHIASNKQTTELHSKVDPLLAVLPFMCLPRPEEDGTRNRISTHAVLGKDIPEDPAPASAKSSKDNVCATVSASTIATPSRNESIGDGISSLGLAEGDAKDASKDSPSAATRNSNHSPREDMLPVAKLPNESSPTVAASLTSDGDNGSPRPEYGSCIAILGMNDQPLKASRERLGGPAFDDGGLMIV
mmetsp:Transcript_37047/g.104525  ORF Transcript_37047/g.104525 Transcript_37047/m.104525 type:complete len:497 (-) Transcript_37047:44-1534(-)